MINYWSLVVFVGGVMFLTSPTLAQTPTRTEAPEDSLIIDLTESGAGKHRGDATYCSFFGEDWKQLSVHSPGVPSEYYHEFSDNVDLIKKYARVNKKFGVRVASVLNAAAVISRKRRYLLFNQNFLTSIQTWARNNNKTKRAVAGARDDWLLMSVVAHEVGHHLAGHTLKLGNQPYNELQADWFTGYLLRKMGAGLDQAHEIQGLGPLCGTLTHPQQSDRVAAVTAGWVQACEEEVDCNVARINLPVGKDCPPAPDKPAIVQAASRPPKRSGRPPPQRAKSPEYDLICKLRDTNYLVKSGTVYENKFDIYKKRTIWKKTPEDMRFMPCPKNERLANGHICLSGDAKHGGLLREGTLIDTKNPGDANIPVGVCAPCARGVCPSTG